MLNGTRLQAEAFSAVRARGGRPVAGVRRAVHGSAVRGALVALLFVARSLSVSGGACWQASRAPLTRLATLLAHAQGKRAAAGKNASRKVRRRRPIPWQPAVRGQGVADLPSMPLCTTTRTGGALNAWLAPREC